METNETMEASAVASPNRRGSWIATAALATGLAVGAAGLAGAATGSGSTASTDAASSSATAAAPAANGTRPDPATMANGPGETLLTGDTATKVTAAALAAVPGSSVIRVESDSSGATYEAHLKKADGSTATVLFDADFKVTSTIDGFGQGPGGPGGPGPNGQAPPAGAGSASGASTTNGD